MSLAKKAVANLGDRIQPAPSRDARKRRYGPEAVAVIRDHLKKAKARRERTTHEAAAYWQALGRLRLVASTLGEAAREVQALYRMLRKNPPTVTTHITTLPDQDLALVQPIPVLLSPLRLVYWRASMAEARLVGDGKTRDEAVLALREEILRTYLALQECPENDPERWNVLDQLVRPKRPSRFGKPPNDEASQREGESTAAALANGSKDGSIDP